jgi:hypothetical protein
MKRASLFLFLPLVIASLGVGPCRDVDLGEDTLFPDASAPGDGAAAADAPAGPDGPAGIACGPGRPECPQGMRCQVEPSCLPAEQRKGVCVAGQAGCPGVYIPVCGCDGRTHDVCSAQSEGLAIVHDGPCPADATTCSADIDCVQSLYDKPVGSAADCYCRACGSPINRLASARYEQSWHQYCEAWSASKPCFAPPCVPPSPVGCVAGRCGTIEPMCGAALRTRTGGGRARCSAGSEARCTQLEREPQRRVAFGLVLRKTDAAGSRALTSEEKERNWTCITGALRERGIDRIEPFDFLGDIRMTATYQQVKDALGLDLVVEYEPGCTSEVCTECDARPVATCAQDAFCGPVVGNRIDQAGKCVLPATAVGCQPFDRSCPPVVTYATDSAGACWHFGGCTPAGFKPDDRCLPLSGGLPACP